MTTHSTGVGDVEGPSACPADGSVDGPDDGHAAGVAARSQPCGQDDFERAILSAFREQGPLRAREAAFRERPAQRELAVAVGQAIRDRSVLVAEAGTGIGKTYAYLVPALLSGRRMLVSTATKSLQDQLFDRDLPHVRAALASPVTAARLKGRGNYLCLHRMELARQGAVLPDRGSVRQLARIEQWAQTTHSGDLAELDGLQEGAPILPLVTSTRENCLGGECPRWTRCHVMQARREAMAADIVVVNHHLFFADLILRDTGMAELLPTVDAVIFDEAHHLVDAGIQFLGQTLSSAQVADLCRDMLATGLTQARGLSDWPQLAGRCEHAMRQLRLAAAGPLHQVRGSLKLRWRDRAGTAGFSQALQALVDDLRGLAAALHALDDPSPDLARLQERTVELAARAAEFAQEERDEDGVRWIDLGPHHVRLVRAPLDIRQAFGERLSAGDKAWVFTSATLGDDAQLGWFTAPVGIEQARIMQLASPFDYPVQARAWVPRGLPRPNDPGHAQAVSEVAARLAGALQGRTFVLTTTLRAMQAIGQSLSAQLQAAGIEVLVQGQAPKARLMARFLTGEPCVLVGSQSFWEGIDVAGSALQCVIIDKLPFPPPSDPLVEARTRRIEQAGGRAFQDYSLAEAAVALKQGAGRLIRSEQDQGLLVVCDTRLAEMSYGRRLWAALPPMTRLQTETQALDYLRALTTAATSGEGP